MVLFIDSTYLAVNIPLKWDTCPWKDKKQEYKYWKLSPVFTESQPALAYSCIFKAM